MTKYVPLFIAAMLLVGCDKLPTLTKATATFPPPPKAVLMVTWLVPGQPPQTTQTVVSDMATCDAARTQTVAAGDAARADRQRQNDADKAQAQAQVSASVATARAQGAVLTGYGPEVERLLRGVPLPEVSAYCILQ